MRAIRLMSVLIMLGLMTGCSMVGVYNIPSIEGRIVDAETETPIEGAVIVIQRGLKGGYEGGTSGYYKYQEAVTDNNGGYIIPSMGIVYTGRRFVDAAPEITVFKAGYKLALMSDVCPSYLPRYKKLCDTVPRNPQASWSQSSIWNGHIIALEKFNGTTKEYKDLLVQLYTRFDSYDFFRKARCAWSGFEMPKWLQAIYTANVIYGSAPYPSVDDDLKMCPQWDAFYKEYKS